MSKFHTILCIFTPFASFCSAQPPETTKPADETVRLVQELGSPSFRQREKADAELLRLGESALPALQQGLKSSNAEIRFRCERLITKIRYEIRKKAEEIRKKTEESRLREFVQTGLQGKLAPNWERFRELVDRDPESKTLLIELHEYDPEYL